MKKLSTFKSRFDRDITRQMREVLKRLDCEYDVFTWSLDISNDEYQVRKSLTKGADYPRREFLQQLDSDHLRFKANIRMTKERYATIRHLPKEFHFDEITGEITVDAHLLLHKRRIMRDHLKNKKMKRVNPSLPITDQGRLESKIKDILNHYDPEKHQSLCDLVSLVLPKQESKSILALIKESKTEYDRKKLEEIMGIVSNTLKGVMIPAGIEYAFDNIYVSLHPIISRAGDSPIAQTLESVSQDFAFGMVAPGLAFSLLSGILILSNPKTTVHQKTEFLIEHAPSAMNFARRVGIFLSPGVPNLGFLSLPAQIIQFTLSEVTHQIKLSRLNHSFKDAKHDLVEEIDDILAEYERSFSHLKTTYTRLKIESQSQDLDVVYLDQIKRLTDLYENSIRDAAKVTAKSAVDLQTQLSYHRMNRILEITKMSLAIGSSFLPPLYLGVVLSQIPSIIASTAGKQYVTNSAAYNHGYEFPSILMVGPGYPIRKSISNVSSANEVTLAAIPFVVRPKLSISKALKIQRALSSIERRNSYVLQLPNTIIEPPMTNRAVMRAVNLWIENMEWFNQIDLRTQNDDRIPADMLNRSQLKATLMSDQSLLLKRLNNQLMRYDFEPLNLLQKKQKHHLELALKKLTSLNKYASLTKEVPMRDAEFYHLHADHLTIYAAQETKDIKRYIRLYTETLTKLDPKFVLKNKEGVISEIEDRAKKLSYILGTDSNVLSSLKPEMDELRKKVASRLSPEVEPQIKPGELEQEIAHQQNRLKKTQSTLRSVEKNEFRLVVADVAFGLTKKSQLQRNARKILQKLKSQIFSSELEPQDTAKIYIQSYDERQSANITNHRVLASRVEGLKTEIQHLNKVIELAPHHLSRYEFADLYLTYQRYESSLEDFSNVAESLRKPKEYTGFWQKWKDKIQRFIYQKRSDVELEKVVNHLGALFNNIPENQKMTDSDSDHKIVNTLEEEPLLEANKMIIVSEEMEVVLNQKPVPKEKEESESNESTISLGSPDSKPPN